MNLLLCYDNEGVYVNTMGRVSKNFVLQWGEMPTSVAYIGTGQIMGWGNKAIEVRPTIPIFNRKTNKKFHCRSVLWKLATLTAYLCTRKLNALSFCVNATTRSSFRVPKVVHPVKSISWLWTNQVWQIGRVAHRNYRTTNKTRKKKSRHMENHNLHNMHLFFAATELGMHYGLPVDCPPSSSSWSYTLLNTLYIYKQVFEPNGWN